MPADLEFPSPPEGVPPPTALKAKGQATTEQQNLLKLVPVGSAIRISFPDKNIADEARVVAYREQLETFLKRTGARHLIFDLDGINLLASSVLGFLVSLKNAGCDVELVNVTPFAFDVLEVTNLVTLFKVRTP